jgi:hypothetical protein
MVKADYRVAKQLVLYGVLKRHSKKHGYCDPADEYLTTRPFQWRGSVYVTKYIDGCFYPFLLELDDDTPASESVENRATKKVCTSKEATELTKWEG